MRQVATHMYVKEVLDGVYEQKDGWDPNILHCARGKISRCNIIGTLLYENNQYSLDDGTAQISLRSYDDIPGLNESGGKLVQVIARPRSYQGSLFLVAEIVREVSADWALVRKAELQGVKSFDASSVSVSAKESDDSSQKEEGISNNAEKIIGIIARMDSGEGALIEEVISESSLGELGEQIINQLLLDGEIFEIKPGVIKVL
jgi:RPA family protein